MDYEKIGNFIVTKRKQLNMTQKDLAEKLGLTDRAISRWERGIGCPDIGIIEELANILKVSVLEILHGEEIKDSVEQNRSVIKLLKEKKKEINKLKIGIIILLNFLLIIFISMMLFIINIGYKENQLKDYQYIEIVSDSMYPEIKNRDIVKIKKVIDDNELYVGNIITFYSQDSNLKGSLITHRIINKYEDKDSNKTYYTTKGDYNQTEDATLITLDDIIGKVDKKIRLSWMNNKYTLLMLLLVVYAIIITDICASIICLKKKVDHKIIN